MQRSILRKRISARLTTTAIVLRIFANNCFNRENFEITPEQYGILSLIVDNKELYQRQLSEITLKDRANISRIIKILEEKKLIIKTPDSNGRKIFKIRPGETATKGITNEELEIFLNTLDKIYLNIRDKVNLQI